MSTRPLGPSVCFLLGELTVVAMLEVLPAVVTRVLTGSWKRLL